QQLRYALAGPRRPGHRPPGRVRTNGPRVRRIEKALEQAGANLEPVVRTPMFVTNIEDSERIGKAHAEFFHDVRPAATMVQVSRLIAPELLIEIEADAYLPEAGP